MSEWFKKAAKKFLSKIQIRKLTSQQVEVEAMQDKLDSRKLATWRRWCEEGKTGSITIDHVHISIAKQLIEEIDRCWELLYDRVTLNSDTAKAKQEIGYSTKLIIDPSEVGLTKAVAATQKG